MQIPPTKPPKIDDFVPRSYQAELIKALYQDKKRKACIVWCRRAGKDMIAWHLAIWQCLQKTCQVFYVFPTQQQARSAIWAGITIAGKTFLDYIPKTAIAKTNEARMEVHFKNGSILSLKGSNNYDSLRGTNPYMCIFSEYAYQDPRVFQLFLSPVLKANMGICVFISTPMGRNHFYELFQIASNSSEWYVDYKTVEDIGHMDVNEIKAEVARGEISEDDMLQEYYCSWDRGIAGAIFGKLIHKCSLDERIGFVPYESSQLVHTAWDLGWDDHTAIIFFQVVGQMVRIIDCYEDRQKDLAHYAQIIYERGYTYGTHFLPHDSKQHALQTGQTRIQVLEDLGLNVEVLPRKSLVDRLEDGKCIFARAWFDEQKTSSLRKSLENYRRQWDDKLSRYKETPVHDWASHFSDAWTYMAGAIRDHTFGNKMTQEDVNRLKSKARSDILSQTGLKQYW